jgi:electron transport complex protein RnfB
MRAMAVPCLNDAQHAMSSPGAGAGVAGGLRIARIEEAACIGCTLCIAACPVDAIVGAAKRMHVVLAALCTGCELCVAPCPVDCVRMVPAGRAWSPEDERAAQARQEARTRRLADRPAHVTAPLAAFRAADEAARATRRKAVAAALDRARARRAAARAGST